MLGNRPEVCGRECSCIVHEVFSTLINDCPFPDMINRAPHFLAVAGGVFTVGVLAYAFLAKSGFPQSLLTSIRFLPPRNSGEHNFRTPTKEYGSMLRPLTNLATQRETAHTRNFDDDLTLSYRQSFVASPYRTVASS